MDKTSEEGGDLMGEVITLQRLKLGEVVDMELDDGIRFKCEVHKYVGDGVYQLRALEGPHKNRLLNFAPDWKRES